MTKHLSAGKTAYGITYGHSNTVKLSDNRDDDNEVETPSRGSTGTTSIEPKIQA